MLRHSDEHQHPCACQCWIPGQARNDVNHRLQTFDAFIKLQYGELIEKEKTFVQTLNQSVRAALSAVNTAKINLLGTWSLFPPRFLRFLAISTGIVAACCGRAGAMQFQPDKETTINVDITLSYGAGWRLKDPEAEKLASANANDGNDNFDQGDLIDNRVGVVTDIDARRKNFGLFLRPRAFYDFVYMGSNADYAGNPLPNNTPDPSDDFPDETQDMHGSRTEILDAFIWTDLSVGQRTLQLRLGNQVIQWGESLFIQGGIASAMAHMDLTAASAPGTELKEILLPSGALSGQIDLTPNTSLSVYYQYDWDKNRYYESGSYFSTTELSGQCRDHSFSSSRCRVQQNRRSKSR